VPASSSGNSLHVGTGLGQSQANRIASHIDRLRSDGITANIQRVKAHEGTLETRADALAGQAAERRGGSTAFSAAWVKLQTSLNYNESKAAWNRNPENHGIQEIPPSPSKRSCVDKTRNTITRVAAQIRTDHLEVSYLPQEHPKADYRGVLVLPLCRALSDDPKLRPALLPLFKDSDRDRERARGTINSHGV
jgi:hypothetical protein